MTVRIDQLLVQRGFARSRTQSQKLIAAGSVRYRVAGGWQTAVKPSMSLAPGTLLQVDAIDEFKYASRAGLKLEGALQHLAYDPTGQVALDVGQSTGGFTDCLLQHGVTCVVGVDVGHDQLIPKLKNDARVICFEGVNARALESADIGEAYPPDGFDLVVMDVSFISQTLILPKVLPLLAAGGQLISLVKPQFEVGADGIAKGGIVRDLALYDQVQQRICSLLEKLGCKVQDYFTSPIAGGDGNREFFVAAQRDGSRSV